MAIVPGLPNPPLAVDELSEEQSGIASEPLDARCLVLAGPGSGKTHVLTERIVHLLDNEDVGAGQEVLVLSFTRAVVGELRRRVGVRSHAARFVQPSTFDSFATRLLSNVPGLEEWEGWSEKSYDGRIAAATHALENHEGAQEAVGRYRHILVDEIQDLVSLRATFVLELLRHCSGGFTLLGDPAQGIYDFQLRKSGGMSPADLIAAVREEYPRLCEVELTRNYRARTPLAVQASLAGSAIRAARPDYARAERDLGNVLADAVALGSIDDLPVAVRHAESPTAILCRTNVEALRISRRLYGENVDHRFQREATERAVPAWVAQLCRHMRFSSVGQSKVENRLEELARESRNVPEPHIAWDLLQRTAGGGDQLDVERLAQRIRERSCPDELNDVVPLPVVISTVHRAKGLEFDNVIFVDPGAPPPMTADEVAEEVRVRFVALTRARDDIYRVSQLQPEGGPWFRCEAADDRWVRSSWQERWKTLGFEIRGDDVDSLRPPGTWIIEDDPQTVQDYLSHEVARGDQVRLELAAVREGDKQVPFYTVVHRTQIIGVTSERFGELLGRRIRPRHPDAKWPLAITGLFVDAVDSVAGLPGVSRDAGLGVSGIWLRPRLIGLGAVDWFGAD